MTWLRPIRPDDAEGPAKKIIGRLRAGGRPVSKFRLALARRPPVLAAREAMRSAAYSDSTLGPRREQMIAYYVAGHGG